MSSTRGNLQHLPPLTDGRRHAHEILDPKPVAKDIRPIIIKRLRIYYAKEHLNPSPSTASQTTRRSRSVSSAGTSQTNMTRVFSVSKFSTSNGSEQRGEETKPLGEALRARKYLTRKLGACREGCRQRKVMCPLYHHRLRDLLEDNQLPEVEALVEWAIQLNGPPSPETRRDSARVELLNSGIIGAAHDKREVMNQVDDVFELQQDEPLQYDIEIGESSAFLLATDTSTSLFGEMEENTLLSTHHDSTMLPRVPPETDNSTPVPRFAMLSRAPEQAETMGYYQYSTATIPGMCWIGEQIPVKSEDNTVTDFWYACCGASECPQWFHTYRELFIHYGREHRPFRELPGDPRRVVCPNPCCDGFYPDTTSVCAHCLSGQLVVMVCGQLVTAVPEIVLTPSNVKTPSESRFVGGPQFPNTQHSKSSSSQSNAWPTNIHSHNAQDFYGSSYRKSVTRLVTISLGWFFSLIPRLLGCAVSRYQIICGAVPSALVLLLLSYETRDWFMTKISRLWTLLSHMTYLGEPILWALIMVAGFTLVRGLHAHRQSGCGGGRCPLHYLKRLSASCIGRSVREADAEHGPSAQRVDAALLIHDEGGFQWI